MQSLLAASLVTVAATPPGSANDSPKLLADPNQAAALATRLGADRTGGTYYKDGRLVVTVTDEAAARTVREAGGVPKLVTRSAAELAAVHVELDELAGIPNTAWGEDVENNQISVEVYGGVSAADQARIAEVVEAHPGAVSINRHGGKLEPAVLRAEDFKSSETVVML
ncbi:alpha-lytic protease prodomain-containing protein [Streptomyces sp. P9-A2]|uniref:alpha-lytic protease prodomain-containing protein n=1 Tax=Streptomyces sp. P9-A2 TaxID=3072284 RepID=UPI002FC60838